MTKSRNIEKKETIFLEEKNTTDCFGRGTAYNLFLEGVNKQNEKRRLEHGSDGKENVQKTNKGKRRYTMEKKGRFLLDTEQEALVKF